MLNIENIDIEIDLLGLYTSKEWHFVSEIFEESENYWILAAIQTTNRKVSDR
jgi:hypothetical protein